MNKTKLGLIFSHMTPDKHTWPYSGYDYEGRKTELYKDIERLCPEVSFVVRTVTNKTEGEQVFEELKDDVAGFVVYFVGLFTFAPEVFARSGMPTLLLDDMYSGSGEFLEVYGDAQRDGFPVVGIATQDMTVVARNINLFPVIQKLKNSRILVFSDEVIAEKVNLLKKIGEEKFGIDIILADWKELDKNLKEADVEQAKEVANHWITCAKTVKEPGEDEILRSARFYLATKKMLEKYDADAITIDCLNFFYGGKLNAYPCMTWFAFTEEGKSGICEADIGSTITELMGKYLTGQPGFVSDPVVDTTRDEIIYAHCVATRKPFGPSGKENPYIIRTHAEDRMGAAVQSLLPTEHELTTIKVVLETGELMIHSSYATGNLDEERACRTKLIAKTDAKRIAKNWKGSIAGSQDLRGR
jgi:hypothetical protein